MERNGIEIIRDGCAAGIAFSAAATCAGAADIESDSLAALFSGLAYQGAAYDAASYVGVAMGTVLAYSCAEKLYKRILG